MECFPFCSNTYSPSTLADFLQYLNHCYSDRPAVVYCVNSQKIEHSYSGLYRDVYDLRRRLEENNLTHRRIAVHGTNSYTWIVLSLAIVLANNTLIPLDADLPVDTISEAVDLMDVEYLVSDAPGRLEAEKCVAFNRLAELDCLLPSQVSLKYSLWDTGHHSDGELEDDASYLFLTSGTTGKPKGVMLSQESMVQSCFGMSQCLEVHGSTLLVLPLSHIYGYCDNLLIAFAQGAVVYLSAGIDMLRNELTLFNPGSIFVVPTLLQSLYVSYSISDGAEKASFWGKNLKSLLVGGGISDPSIIIKYSELGIHIINGYGMTETCGCICIMPSNHIVPESVGRVTEGNTVVIREGEIYIKTPHMMEGYYNNKALTASVLHEGWYKTGDLGYFSDGFLYVMGRQDAIRSLPNGKKIAVMPIEDRLISSEGVLSVKLEVLNGMLTAFLDVDSSRCDISSIEEEIIEINRCLPAGMRIQDYVIRPKRRDSKFYVPSPSNMVFPAVVELIQTITGSRDPITPNTSFSLDLHMDSIQIIYLIQAAEDRFAVNFEIKDLQPVETVQDMVTLIEKQIGVSRA